MNEKWSRTQTGSWEWLMLSECLCNGWLEPQLTQRGARYCTPTWWELPEQLVASHTSWFHLLSWFQGVVLLQYWEVSLEDIGTSSRLPIEEWGIYNLKLHPPSWAYWPWYREMKEVVNFSNNVCGFLGMCRWLGDFWIHSFLVGGRGIHLTEFVG